MLAAPSWTSDMERHLVESSECDACLFQLQGVPAFSGMAGSSLLMPPDDCEDDGDVALPDYAQLWSSMTGHAGVPPVGTCCRFECGP